MKQERIDSVQSLRGIACVGVMLMHTNVIRGGGYWLLGSISFSDFVGLFIDE